MSFGLQSTAPAVLAGLGRRHRPGAAALVSAAVTRAGFATWSFDLIFGARRRATPTGRAPWPRCSHCLRPRPT